MKTANQFTFTTYEAFLKLKQRLYKDWSFVDTHLKGQRTTIPFPLFKAQLLIYRGFNFLKTSTPSPISVLVRAFSVS